MPTKSYRETGKQHGTIKQGLTLSTIKLSGRFDFPTINSCQVCRGDVPAITSGAADDIVSKIDLSGITVSEIVHRFSLQQLALEQGQGTEPEQNIDISLNLQIKDQTVAYQLWVGQRQQASSEFQSHEFTHLVKPEAKKSFGKSRLLHRISTQSFT